MPNKKIPFKVKNVGGDWANLTIIENLKHLIEKCKTFISKYGTQRADR